MKKILNCFAIWLYKKTKKENIQTPKEFLSGIKVIESKHILKGIAIFGTGDMDELRYSSFNNQIKNL